MLEKQFFHRMNKEKLITKGDKLLLAISGGADSVALFYLLKSIQKTYNLTIKLIYVNHNLRPDAQVEEEYVSALALKENVQLFKKKWTEQPKTGIEKQARDFRYQFFQEVAGQEGITKIITAHHADDLMETILMKFIRGTYILHLSGIKQKRKRNNCEIIRPLLHFSKAELEEYLNEKGISFIYDASNESDKYFRNRIRTNILPHIQAQNPNYIEKVNQFSQEVSYLSDFLAIETQKFYEKHLVINENGFWLTGLKRLNRAQKFVYISQVFEKYYQGELIISQVQMENLLDGLSQNQYPLTIQLQFGAYLQLKSDELRLFKR